MHRKKPVKCKGNIKILDFICVCKKKGTIYELTLQLKTTRIILINNLNNLIQQHCARNNTARARDYYLKDNERQLGSYLAIRLERSASFASLIRLYVNYRQFKDIFCFCSNEMQLCRIWRAKQN